MTFDSFNKFEIPVVNASCSCASIRAKQDLASLFLDGYFDTAKRKDKSRQLSFSMNAGKISSEQVNFPIQAAKISFVHQCP